MLEAYSELSPTLLVSENRSVSSRASPLSVKEDTEEKISKMIGKKGNYWLTQRYRQMNQNGTKQPKKLPKNVVLYLDILHFAVLSIL